MAELVKRFELSARDERRFTNDENRTRWAAGRRDSLSTLDSRDCC